MDIEKRRRTGATEEFGRETVGKCACPSEGMTRRAAKDLLDD